jgi:hypothetical protein
MKTLLPNVGALVALTQTPDGLGRGPEALQVLGQHYRSGTNSTDALGVLAGRLKRRWPAERRPQTSRAAALFRRTHQNRGRGRRGLSFHHAINIDFLDLMAAPATAGVAAHIREVAQRALHHCNTVLRRTKTTGGFPPRRKPPWR